MEHTIEIRRVHPGDAEALARIQTESWKAAFRDILKPDVLERLTRLENAVRMYDRLLDVGKGNGYLLKLDGAPHCIAWWDAARDGEKDCAELICIHSLQENWRMGCGSRMMARVLADMHQAGFKKVMLWVFRENARARAFYEKWGFCPGNREQDAFGVVEMVYQRDFAVELKISEWRK